MDSLTVDNIYGKALYDAAEDCGKVDLIASEIDGVSEVFKEYPDLKKLFLLPTVPVENKKAAAQRIFKGEVSDEMLHFLCILIDKRRVGAWDGIAKRYKTLIDERDGLTKGILYSAVKLDEKRVRQFEKEAGEALLKTVKLENRVDAGIIGGAVVFVDGKLIDMSIRNKLERMKQSLLG